MLKKHNKFKFCVVAVLFAAILSGCWDAGSSNNATNSTSVNYAPEITNNKPKNTNQSNVDNSDNSNSKTQTNSKGAETGFLGNLPSGFQQPTDSVGQTLLKAYGSFFVAKNGTKAPTAVAFPDAAAVSSFQSTLATSPETIGGVRLELQSPAMKDLLAAIADAKATGQSITPVGTDSAKRTYEDTVGLWKGRVNNGLVHWVKLGKITKAEAERIKGLSIYEQISAVLKLEESGVFFASSLDKSIIYSVAPPGTSQHLAMLALDVKEHEKQAVRDILAKHGWFQTVVSDLPHFTYIGVAEDKLVDLGLKKVSSGGRTYYLPNI